LENLTEVVNDHDDMIVLCVKTRNLKHLVASLKLLKTIVTLSLKTGRLVKRLHEPTRSEHQFVDVRSDAVNRNLLNRKMRQ
jgi:hypothetical protein